MQSRKVKSPGLSTLDNTLDKRQVLIVEHEIDNRTLRLCYRKTVFKRHVFTRYASYTYVYAGVSRIEARDGIHSNRR